MLVVGATAFLLSYAVLRDNTDLLELVVAATDLPAGVVIEERMLGTSVIQLADSIRPPGVLSRTEADAAVADGATLTAAIPAGSVLRESDLTNTGPPRARAMAVSIDRAHAVDGAIAPGDIVDIVVVERGTARFALVSVHVTGVSDPGGTTSRAMTLTVEVDEDSALRLAHAMSMGSLEVVRATGAEPADADAVYPLPHDVSTEEPVG
jgi:Flp pilus assembly protein CpaB